MAGRGGGGGGERERERERETDRQTDRPTDRQTDRQTETERQTGRETEAAAILSTCVRNLPTTDMIHKDDRTRDQNNTKSSHMEPSAVSKVVRNAIAKPFSPQV